MDRQPTISNSTIFALVAFICAAIMTSLFVFHMRENTPPSLKDEEGMLFSAPRDIKPFELVSATGEFFTQQNLRGHWTLLFFGFTHCASICPTTLDLLKRAYVKLHPTIPNLQVVFVSLDPERDNLPSLRSYTSAFHPDFIGVSGKTQELHKLQSQLGIYSERDNATQNYQILHTPNILLINPQGQWSGIYRNELPLNQFIQALQKGIHT
jgi:protein SCO1/2